MKKIFRGFVMYSSLYSAKTALQMFVGACIASVLILLLELPDLGKVDLVNELISAVCPIICIVIPMGGVFLLNSIYSYTSKATPGYRYFHAADPDGTQFRFAIIGANIIALGACWLTAAFTYITDSLLHQSLTLIMAPVSFAMVGVINFAGYAKSIFARVISLMPMLMFGGFCAGFFSASSEDGTTLPAYVTTIAFSVAAAIYIFGLVFSLAVSRRKWSSEHFSKNAASIKE